MPRRYFNWKLACVLLIGLIVLTVTAFALRKWQRNRIAYSSLEQGNVAYEESRWPEAAKHLGRYIAVASDDVPSLLKYAHAQINIRPLKHNNLQQGIGAYRAVLRIDRNNAEAASKLVEIYLQMGMHGEAELIATRVLQGDGVDKEIGAAQTEQSVQLRRMLAVAFIGQRRFEEAAGELEAIISEHPDRISAYELLGALTEQRPEDFSRQPAFWFDEAIKNNPSSAQAYIARGAYYLRLKDKTKAVADLQQAEKHDLSDPLVRLHLARELIAAGVLDSAEKHLVAIQDVEPANQMLWQIWARLALRLNSEATILKVADTGLKELSSQPWDFLPVAAELYIRCDKLDLADKCIDRLRQEDLMPSTTAFLQGLSSEKKGQYYEAAEHWRRAMQLGNNSPQISLALALATIRSGDTQSALRQARSMVSQYPNSLDVRVLLARLLSQTGSWAQAAEHSRIAMRISPDSLDATLLYISSQMQLLAEKRTPAESQAYRDIEDTLVQLDETAGNVAQIKVLRLQLAMLRSDIAGAETLTAELKDDHPGQLKPAMVEVEMLRAAGNTEQTITKLNELTEQFPQSVEPVQYLAKLMSQQDKHAEAERNLKDALLRIEEPASRRELALLLAGLYTQWGQGEDAYQLLNSITDELPRDILLKRSLLSYRQSTEDLANAQQLVDSIKTLEGQDGWQWRYEQARLWFIQDNFDKLYPQIISILRENLLRDPDDQSSRVLLAAACEKAGQLPLAVSTYREALSRSPKDLRIIVPAVAAFYKANEYDYADRILRQAASENLFHPELKRLALQSYLKRGQLGSAGDMLESLLDNDPDNRAVRLSLALLKIRQKQFAEAQKLLDNLKTAEPDSFPVTVAQIELNLQQNNPDEAIRLCDEIINKSENATGYMLRARTLVFLGETEKAEKDFQQATALEPDNSDTWTAMSDFYRSSGQPDKAASDIQKAMSLAPDNLSIQKRAIILSLASGSKDTIAEGRSILDKALADNPADVELRLYKSRLLLSEATAPAIKQAMDILKKIIAEQPEQNPAWTLLAQTALTQEQTAEAIDIALRGLVYHPDDKSLLLLKAEGEARRSPRLAIPTLKAMLDAYPDDTVIALRLIEVYIGAGQPQQAVELAGAQLASSEQSADTGRLRIALAIALHKSGDKAQAQEIFDSLIEAAPDDTSPFFAQIQLMKDDQLWPELRQKAFSRLEKHPEETDVPLAVAVGLAQNESSQAKAIAKDMLGTILDRRPDYLPAMNALAMLLQMTGETEESAVLYRRIIDIEPENVIAMNNLAWIMCQDQQEYQAASELATRGLQIAPTYVDLIDTRGVSYYKLGRYDDAIADFNKCLKLYPAAATARTATYMHLGRALAKSGRNGQAVENLKKSLEMNARTGGLSADERADTHNLIETLEQRI